MVDLGCVFLQTHTALEIYSINHKATTNFNGILLKRTNAFS